MLTSNKRHLAISDGQEKHLIGFLDNRHAHYVKKVLAPQPSFHVKKGERMDVTQDVKKELLEKNIPIFNVADNVCIYTDSEVGFEKTQNIDELMRTSSYDVQTISYGTFLAYPFTNNLGLIISSDILRDTKDEVLFRCAILSPILRDSVGSLQDLSKQDT